MKPDDRREGRSQRDLFATRDDLDLRRERADDLRYEGPLTVGADAEEEEEEDYDSGSGKAFFTAAIVGGIVILLVGAALWFRSGTEELISTEENARLAAAASVAASDPRPLPPAESAPIPATPRAVDPLEEGYRRAPDAAAPTRARGAGTERQAAAAKPPRPAPAEVAMRPAGSAAGSVRELVAAGELEKAARAGEGEVRAAGPWTLQVLFACQPDTVQRAFRAVPSASLSLATADSNGRTCWRLLYGSYADREAAVAAIGSVPDYFRQSGTPRPVETR